MANYYDTITEQWHSTRGTLPNKRGQTIGLRNAPKAILAENGIIDGVVDAVPDGMVHTGTWSVEIIDGIAHRVPTCVTESAAAIAEADRIYALAANPVYSAMVDELQTDLQRIGLTIPCTEQDVMVHVATLKAQGAYTDAHRQAKASIAVTWQAAKDAGLADDIGAIWEAMQQ